MASLNDTLADFSAKDRAATGPADIPLVAHLVYSWSCGGLEKMLSTVIQRTPRIRYRHAIICLTRVVDADFEIAGADIPVFSLHKRPGKDPLSNLRLYRLLRELRPAILHTRNIGTIEGQFVARAAGVPAGVHGAHGRDIYDLDGSRYLWLRRLMRPFIDRYIAVSRDLGRWMIDTCCLPAERVTQIYNGVNTDLFHPRGAAEWRSQLPPAAAGKIIIGTVERLQPVKAPLNLIQAFAHLVQMHPDVGRHVHLVVVGDGPLRQAADQMVQDAGLAETVTMMGQRSDIADLMRMFDVFVLPSIAEGTSNTILEAMATGLPVLATDVGGNSELVRNGVTGLLVPARNPESLAAAMLSYVKDAELRATHGRRGRQRILSEFSLAGMTESYLSVYDEVLAIRRSARVHRLASAAVQNPVGQTVKYAAISGFRYSGLNRWARSSARRQLTVLCYHGVVKAEHSDQAFVYRNAVPQAEFERQILRIKEWFTPVSLPAAVAHLYEGAPLPDAPVLITFDDGYRNNAICAAPVMTKHRVPALFFLTTAHVGSTRNLWANDIDLRILSYPNTWIPFPGRGGATFIPEDMKARQNLAFFIRSRCKTLTAGELAEYLARLEAAAPDIDRSRYAELFDFLSWEEARALAHLGFDIGSHTVNHPILSRLADSDVVRELRDSKWRIEQEIGQPCDAISYPNGGENDYSCHTLKAARESGYRVGFSLKGGRAESRDPLALDRINVPGHVPECVFEAVISGASAAIRRARTRRHYD